MLAFDSRYRSTSSRRAASRTPAQPPAPWILVPTDAHMITEAARVEAARAEAAARLARVKALVQVGRQRRTRRRDPGGDQGRGQGRGQGGSSPAAGGPCGVALAPQLRRTRRAAQLAALLPPADLPPTPSLPSTPPPPSRPPLTPPPLTCMHTPPLLRRRCSPTPLCPPRRLGSTGHGCRA